MDPYDNKNKLFSWPLPRILLPALAIALSCALLGAWFGALAAPEAEPVNKPLAQFPAFDMAINKSQVPTIFTVGTNNRYIINVSRTNTETVTEAPRVEDELPDGMTITTINATDTAGAWDCSTSTSKLVSCVWSQYIPPSLTTFPAIIVGIRVASDIVVVTVVNTATLLTVDAFSGNNSSSVATTIDSVDLQIAKAVSNAYPDVGEVFTYTLWITNTGPSDAVNVTVDVDLSTYMDYYPVVPAPSPPPNNPSQGTYNHLTGIWTVGSIPKDGSAKLTFRASPKDIALGQKITNTAVVTSTNTSDWNTSNNHASTDVIVRKLEITKSVPPSTCEAVELEPCYYVGKPIPFTISVTNHGDLSISNVSVTDHFTNTLDIIDYSYTISPPDGLPTTYGPFTSPRNFIKNFGELGGHNILTISINARANRYVNSPKEIENIARVNADPDLEINSNKVTLYLQPAVDLILTKSNGVNQVHAGTAYDWVVTIQNNGSIANSTNIIFTDTFSINVTDIVLTKGAFSMTQLSSPNPHTIVWAIGTHINPGASMTFSVRGRIVPGAMVNDVVSNTGSVFLTRPSEPIPGWFEEYGGNNIATDIDIVAPPPVVDLAIYKNATGKIWHNGWVDVPNLVAPGQLLTYNLLVANHGEALAINVVVKDFMPTGMTILAINPSQGSCFTGVQGDPTKPYSCYLNNIEGGSQAIISILILIPSSTPLGTMYYNYATVTNNVSDANPANNAMLNITSVKMAIFFQFLTHLINGIH